VQGQVKLEDTEDSENNTAREAGRKSNQERAREENMSEL
jgi:hypothetical protein